MTAGNLSKNLQYVGYFPYLLYLLSESIKHRKLKLINSFQRNLHKRLEPTFDLVTLWLEASVENKLFFPNNGLRSECLKVSSRHLCNEQPAIDDEFSPHNVLGKVGQKKKFCLLCAFLLFLMVHCPHQARATGRENGRSKFLRLD